MKCAKLLAPSSLCIAAHIVVFSEISTMRNIALSSDFRI